MKDAVIKKKVSWNILEICQIFSSEHKQWEQNNGTRLHARYLRVWTTTEGNILFKSSWIIQIISSLFSKLLAYPSWISVKSWRCDGFHNARPWSFREKKLATGRKWSQLKPFIVERANFYIHEALARGVERKNWKQILFIRVMFHHRVFCLLAVNVYFFEFCIIVLAVLCTCYWRMLRRGFDELNQGEIFGSVTFLCLENNSFSR